MSYVNPSELKKLMSHNESRVLSSGPGAGSGAGAGHGMAIVQGSCEQMILLLNLLHD